jgi:hypothetical protein
LDPALDEAMMRFISGAIVSAALLAVSTAAAQVREQNPNLVGGELMGRGLIVTLNYERFVTNNLGFGGGFMMIGTSDDLAGVLPLYLSVLTGDVHSLYLSGGVTILFGSDDGVGELESETAGTVAVGYQFHSYGGFFVRPLFTTLFANDEFLIWPGITIGGSF